MLSGYCTLLAISCLGLQYVALAVYLLRLRARRWMEPVWCFLNPLLYVAVIEPAMQPSLPWFRAALFIIFCTYWADRLFALFPRAVHRELPRAVIAGCILAALRATFAVQAGDKMPFGFALIPGGYGLIAIPVAMAVLQLRNEPAPLLNPYARTQLSLLLAALGCANALSARHYPPLPEGAIEAAARAHQVSPVALAALASNARPTFLQRALEQTARDQLLADPSSHLVSTGPAADIRMGPFQLTPRETMLALRRSGRPFSKDFRETPYEVRQDLPDTGLKLGKPELLEALQDERSADLAALVLRARQSR